MKTPPWRVKTIAGGPVTVTVGDRSRSDYYDFDIALLKSQGGSKEHIVLRFDHGQLMALRHALEHFAKVPMPPDAPPDSGRH